MIAARSRASPTPLSALRDEMALPSGVRGPVDFSQGLVWRIRSACLARRSGVHVPFVPVSILFSSFRRFLPPSYQECLDSTLYRHSRMHR